ncbi:hypothetical protein [Achromobacter xylosoxidans]|uniref:hypothetical protein n=1 Tax=Alcaligenes xylosoxydans xylosoxydans TaxID=85698 RepID=UPI000666C4B6|nr:hypothetical protein [Achromobacter xylosoxidans]AMH06555.1 hypothetical protein AL509_21860 [Achromobacter xylosoxidans]MCH4575284.1 hypothetical protein [Achromobacter xylosoxidans]
MKIDLVEYIVRKSPELLFTRMVEKLEEAYFAAHQHAETFPSAERRRVLGQLRHYRQNVALREAGEAAGLIAAAPHTDPKGERYSLVAADDIRFGRIGVAVNNKLARFSKHRATIAALNERLEPLNNDLFNAPSERPTDGLGCLLVTVNPHYRDEQSVPAAIMVGVPYTNLRGWHLFEPISNVIAAYNPASEIEVPDLAWVKLKKQLGGAEG